MPHLTIGGPVADPGTTSHSDEGNVIHVHGPAASKSEDLNC